MLRRLFGGVFAGLLLAGLGTAGFTIARAAASAQRYIECDDAYRPDYPDLYAAPQSCNLGMGLSYYDVQSVPGRSFGMLGLRRLRWSGWGAYKATAHGVACNIYGNGGADWSACAKVTVNAYDPQSIGPSGGAVIYQLTRVRHTQGGGYRQFTYWYQPGTDY